jgi:acetoin utilization deacetylase AcuC-like enzyme/ankyrin repeat protein
VKPHPRTHPPTAPPPNSVAGHASCAKALLEAGAEVEYKLEQQSALHLALAHGCLDGRAEAAAACVQLLLGAEASLEMTDDLQRTPLHVAAALGLSASLKLLLEADTENKTLSALDRALATPLHTAARGGHGDCVDALLSAGAPTGCTDRHGSNELHAAAYLGACDAIRLLLRASNVGPAASVLLAAKDSRGRTPAEVAALRGHAEAASLLSPAGAPAVSVAPHVRLGPTLILAPPDCDQHRTAAVLARGAPEPPPENPRRLDALLDPAQGVLHSTEFADPARVLLDRTTNRAAQLGDVLRCHEWSYVRRLQAAIRGVPDAPGVVGSLDGDTGVSAGSFRAALAAAGAVCEAVDRMVAGTARNAFCAVRPPGHHAGPFGPVSPSEPPGSGSHGFCLLNNVAIGAAYAMAVHRGTFARVAIVDFDVHHGQGTEACVEAVVPSAVRLPFTTVATEGTLRVQTCKPWLGETDRHNVFFASVHGFGGGFYPGTGPTVDTDPAGGGLSLTSPLQALEWDQDGVVQVHRSQALEGHPTGGPRVIDVGMAGTGPKSGRGEAWRRVWAGRVLPCLDAFAPDLIFVSAGFDAHAKDDIQGPVNLGVTEPDYEWLTAQLVAIANTHAQGRIISVLEGGYRVHGGPASAFGRSVAAHVRALSNPSAERYDGVAERDALHAFWARRAREQAEAQARADAELAALQADAGADAAAGVPAGDADDAGGRRKRPRAAVDYAALAEKLKEEESARQASAPVAME